MCLASATYGFTLSTEAGLKCKSLEKYRNLSVISRGFPPTTISSLALWECFGRENPNFVAGLHKT